MRILSVSYSQLKRTFVNSRLVVSVILLLFIKLQIVDPFIAASDKVVPKAAEAGDVIDGSISVFQPFISLGNSGAVSLLLPLFLLIVLSGFPSAEEFDLFVHIRFSRIKWVISEMLVIVGTSVVLTVLIGLASGIMLGKYASFGRAYSETVTHYLYYFRGETGEYVLELLPANLYNQQSFDAALLHSFLLLVLEFILFGMIILFFAVINRKILGVLLDFILIVGGTIMTAADFGIKWIFPMPHTIIWLHYERILRKPKFPLWGSYMYLLAGIFLFGMLSLLFAKRYLVNSAEEL